MASLLNAGSSMGLSTYKSAGIGVDVWTDSMLQRDQQLSMHTAQPPPALPAFRFQPKRSRIDWRMLHGIDINSIMRDVDLDTLEKIVSIVAFGDIDAEDTRHLTELNFLKIFKLAQLVIEYLLYVQDSLQTTNHWLKSDRSQLEKYIEVTRLRVKELSTEARSSKRELRRARKTAKTYETMVALGKLPAAGIGTMGLDKTSLLAGDSLTTAHQAKEAAAAASAMESMLRSELLVLSERLARTETESVKLRADREELMVHLRDIDGALRNRAGGGLVSKTSADSAELRSAKDQLNKAHADNKLLRSEKEDLTARLGSAQQRAEVLQVEKEALLQEMAARPGDVMANPPQAGRGMEAGGSPTSLSAMLLDAEARNKALQSELDQLQSTVGTLQKQLMRAAKDAAKPALPNNSPSVEELQRALTAADSGKAELSARVAQLEQQLNTQQRAHDQALSLLQDELSHSHAHMADLQQQLDQAHAAQGNSHAVARDGFVPDDKVSSPAYSSKDTARLQQQLSDLEHALADAQHTAQAQASELQSRCTRLSDQLNLKEQLLADAWKLVKELQAQLTVPAANRDPEAVGRVKAQVQEFEQIAQAALPPVPEQALDTGSSPARTGAAVTPAVASGISPTQQKHLMEQELNSGADSPHNSSFKFAKPEKTPTRSPDAITTGAAGSNHTGRDQNHAGVAVSERDAVGEADTPNVSRALSQNVFASPQKVQVQQANLQQADIQQQQQQQQQQQAVKVQRQRLSPEQISAINQRVLQHMAGKTPDEVALIAEEEMRVLSEHPYEYADDDEAHFRDVFRHELPGTAYGGVLSAQPHTMQERDTALQLHGNNIMDAMRDALASYGIDNDTTMLSDRRYAAAMTELSQRRDAAWSRLAPEQQEQAVFLRDAMLTHLELVTRKVAGAGVVPAFPEPERRMPVTTQGGATTLSVGSSSPVTLTGMYRYDSSDVALSASKAGAAQKARAAASVNESSTALGHGFGQGGTGTTAPSGQGSAVVVQGGQSREAAGTSQLRQQVLQHGQSHSGEDMAEEEDVNEEGTARVQAGPKQGPAVYTGQTARSAVTPHGAGSERAQHGADVSSSLNQSMRSGSNSHNNSHNNSQNQASSMDVSAKGAAANIASVAAPASTPFLQLAGAISLADGMHSPNSQSLPRSAATTGGAHTAGGVSSGTGGLNSGAGSLNATSRAGSAAGSPTAARAAAAAGQQGFNQSLHKKASQQALNQSLHRTAGSNPALNMTSGSAAGHKQGGIANMNMSIRSNGTAKASLRDYSTHMFDDDDEEEDAGLGAGRPSHNRSEYDLDEEEGEQMDQGLQDDEDRASGNRTERLSSGQQAAGMPPKAPSQATPGGWAASGSANRTIERSSSPSRLSKVSSSEGPLQQDIADLPPTVFNTIAQQHQPWQQTRQQQPALPQPQVLHPGQMAAQQGQVPSGRVQQAQQVQQQQPQQQQRRWQEEQEEDHDDWDSPPASSYQLPLVQPQRLQVQTQQQPEAGRPPRPVQQEQVVVPKVLQAKLSGNWADGSSLPREVAGGASPASDAHDYDVASIHSFHPNDTTHSNRNSIKTGPLSPGVKAAGPAAWGSPSATIRSRAAAPPSESSLKSANWNETIQTFHNGANEEVQVFKDPHSADLPAGSWVIGTGVSARPGVMAGKPNTGMVKQPLRKDSFDSVSDVEYF